MFDLDDTLYAERDYAFSGFAAVARAFTDRLGDTDRTEADLRRLFDSDHRSRVFNALVAERGRGDDAPLVARMVDVYRSHSPTIRLYPDAEAALSRLRPDYKLGLISDGCAAAQWAKVVALNLRSRLDEIIVTSELDATGDARGGARSSAETAPPAFAKPHPRAFELMAGRLGVAPRECVYVADNPAKDFIAPNALAWLTIRIHRRDGVYRDAIAAPDGQPKHCIDSLDALDALLG
ncbi:MAG: HAD family hydrolase [Phycisphaerales bacterium]|nr:HAD family hydrolase [Phycisphaerales bacterium]